MLNNKYFTHAEQIPYSTFPKLRRFLHFFGPNELQFKEYLYQVGRESDPRMIYIKNLVDYFFVHRESLKAKSNLHNLVLDRQEKEKLIVDCQKYLAKFEAKAEDAKKAKRRLAK